MKLANESLDLKPNYVIHHAGTLVSLGFLKILILAIVKKSQNLSFLWFCVPSAQLNVAQNNIFRTKIDAAY